MVILSDRSHSQRESGDRNRGQQGGVTACENFSMKPRTIERLVIAFLFVATCVVFAERVSRPPVAVAASAPQTAFSAERAMKHVLAIAQRPHPVGSAEHDRVRDYLIAQLGILGLEPQVQNATGVGTRYAGAGRVQNILARMPGGQSGGPAVLLVAHYDSVEAGPGAADDGAGIAAILETVRALRAGGPVAHDVIVLFTDGEESDLLGAAAFVREHPWARDVAIALNFEARGTSGRSLMFETGPGNLDAVRVLRTVPGVTAGSVFTTIYRTMPNDTDLSELALLGTPALNFAFGDGAARYHTSHDDIAHLNTGSLQHHGQQALALAHAFANGPLPRPRTGDAVFFDLPLIGLVVYSEKWAMPLALVAAALALAVGIRSRGEATHFGRDVAMGAAATLGAIVLSVAAAYFAGRIISLLHTKLPWGGAPAWSPVYWAAIALLSLAVSTACYVAVRRRGSVAGVHAGALLVWTLLSLAAAAIALGSSYLFTWPVLVVTLAASLADGRSLLTAKGIATGLAALMTGALLIPIAYLIGAIFLGVTAAGGIVTAAIIALIAWLLVPLLEALCDAARWSTPVICAAVAIVLVGMGALTVRTSDVHPVPSRLIYAIDADSSDAWLASRASTARADAWTRTALAPSTQGPEWIAHFFLQPTAVVAKRVPHLPLPQPTINILSDSTTSDARQLSLRVQGSAGTTALGMRVTDAPVISAAIDGRAIDTRRYRLHMPEWTLWYWAPSDSGALLSLIVPAGSTPKLEILAYSLGIPTLPGVTILPRPADVVPVQSGDVTIVCRRFSIPPNRE
jgi:peptidase M28-like protein